jgi:3-deoxy-D-manno-octulosonic-acid transferase
LNSFQRKNIAIFIYQTLMTLLYAVARLVSLVYRDTTFRERLGFYSAQDRQRLAIGYNVWLHAASAGEVNAILPFCRALKEAKPEARIILTTTSRTGRRLAREKEVADAVFLAPLDMTAPLRRAFLAFRPVMVLIAETEIWPNWFLRTGHNGISLVLINGRISDKSFPSYRRFKSLFSPALNCLSECLVQTQTDLERLRDLGVSDKRIQVAGQMKYDLSAPEKAPVEKFRGILGLRPDDILFTLGSLREGEDDLLLALVPEILGLSPRVKILVAPRHLKNAPIFREKLEKCGVKSALRSGSEKGLGSERVIVLDTLGELSLAYALSRAAFVGGTLVPVGGHNVMEPALSAVPVCFGPHHGNVREAVEALVKSGGGVLLQEAAELTAVLKGFLDEAAAKKKGHLALLAVASMRGATQMTVKRVLSHWPTFGKT